MGQRHLSSIYRHLVTEVKGKYATLREVRYDEDKKDDQRFQLISRKTANEVASMTVRSLPGCCGVAILHTFKGDSDAVLDFIWAAIPALKKAKYGQVIFTLRSDSGILRTFLAESVESTDHGGGVLTFMNGKTGHEVTTVVLKLDQEAPKAKDTDGE